MSIARPSIEARTPPIVVVDVHRVAYSDVPTPQEVALSKELLALQADRDVIEARCRKEIVQLETRLHEADLREGELLQRLQATHLDHVEHEHVAVLAERDAWKDRLEAMQAEVQKHKIAQRAEDAWHHRFGEHMLASRATASGADVVFSRFGQTIALLPAFEAHNVVRAGSLAFLANILRETESDMVVGPVLVALTHIAIAHDELRHAIVLANALSPLVHLLETSSNPAVLTEAARLLAALASAAPNKTPLATKPAVKALGRLLLVHEASSSVLVASLAALVNLTHSADVLRTQVVNANVVPIVSRLLGESADLAVQVEAANVLCKVSFSGVSNQTTVLMAQGDAELVSRLRDSTNLDNSTDLVRQLQRSAALGVANLASTSSAQIALGYCDVSTSCLQLLVDAKHPPVLEACALVVAALCYQCKVNKVRLAAQNGLHVCVYVLGEPRRFGADDAVLTATCLAVATLVLTDANARTFDDVDGPSVLVPLCLRASMPALLEASAMAIAALVPTPEFKHKRLSCGKALAVERAGVPSWLQTALMIFRASSGELEACLTIQASDVDVTNPRSDELESVLPEVFPRSYLCRQVLSHISPDPVCTEYYKPKPATQ
ncbi:hypothetical protein SPRG_20789 [Saprolegnia parasitica CBS 223.65]|uniref:Uncharacterized protein n=1 Tax=Saprolegnia parasitica (strain CBS 223.65) TaxID=695850 RepID=A0A067C7V4_SAPPC|nr:hypothetical protein SPRG_20789 [Saprolegnia parasitica CBS 223.65]KDO25210.1 hypothetical protein SPRG_20789 [Saprolegnia parasitica CBS 223.65]|eukprot:XP_012204116.1 hypothetical protein SPRG_20789 [Saprolegnia parasitica CBS 223.65]